MLSFYSYPLHQAQRNSTGSIMVSFKDITESNEALRERMNGLTCVFAGAACDTLFGQSALKALAAQAANLTVFLVDNDEKRANRVIKACKNLSRSSNFIFLKADLKHLKEVDRVCNEINLRVAKLDLLHMTQGSVVSVASTLFRKGKSHT
jgi:NADP-dependent 3-hydroxy acid dehydrogenase YdfG